MYDGDLSTVLTRSVTSYLRAIERTGEIVLSMRFFTVLYPLLLLALTGHTSSTQQKYSAWMLESIMSRGEGITAADGLLGEIQKV